jgi:hypothetical protein
LEHLVLRSLLFKPLRMMKLLLLQRELSLPLRGFPGLFTFSLRGFPSLITVALPPREPEPRNGNRNRD